MRIEFSLDIKNKGLGKQSAYINQNRVLGKLSSLVWNISNETESFKCPRSRHVHVGLDVLRDAHGQPQTHEVHAGRKYTHVTSVRLHVKNILELYIPRAKQLHWRPHTTHNTQHTAAELHTRARKRSPPTQNTTSLTHTLCWPNKQTETHTHTHSHTQTHKKTATGEQIPFHFPCW